MNLQTLLFPKIGICTENRLYFRFNEFNENKKIENGNYNYQNQYLNLNKKDVVSFDTYFNSFSIEKWKKYTKLKKLNLRLKITGNFIISLIRKDKIGEIILNKFCLNMYFQIVK